MRPVNNISGGQVGRSRLLDLLLRDGRQRLNNGTVAGGLAHVLQQGMKGYQIGQEREAQQKAAADEVAAMNAMTRGMTAQQWQPPAGDTIYDGPNGQPMSREDAAARAAPAGGYAGGISALQGLGPDNAAAGRLTFQLLMNKMERDQTIADRDEQRKYDEGIRKQDYQHEMDLQKLNNGPSPGHFLGNNMDAQYANTLLRFPPNSQEYAIAYNALAEPKQVFDLKTQTITTIRPNMSAYPPPTYNGMPANPNSDAPTSASPVSGVTVETIETPASQAEKAKAVESLDLTIGSIDSILNDPALGQATGPLDAFLPTVRGSTRRVEGKMDQLQGQTFLTAYERLKGGGTITEVEGKKAEAAISRLNRNLSDEDYVEAAKELRSIFERARQRLKGVKTENLPPIYVPKSSRPPEDPEISGGDKTPLLPPGFERIY